MDIPYNGRRDGTLSKVDVLQIPCNEPADNVEYVIDASHISAMAQIRCLMVAVEP